MPMDPVSIEASSDRMSPNMLPVTITSNFLGLRTSRMAALSTSMWESHIRIIGDSRSSRRATLGGFRGRSSCPPSTAFLSRLRAAL